MAENTFHASLQIIHKNNTGYIGVCPCCEDVQFCLGNVISFMPKDAFLKLNCSFQKIFEKFEERFLIMPNGKKITVRTPVDNLLLSFSKKEFLQVIELFDKMAANIRLSESLKRIEYLN